MSDYIVRKQVVLKATPATVWDALTNPDKTKKYFFGCKVFSDWKPGGLITFKGRMFLLFPIEMTGKIVKVVPERLLEYTLSNKDGSQSAVTDELIYQDGVTTLYITDNVGTGKGAEKRYERSMKGWNKILGGLKKLVEG